ncbi:alkaline phosphatase [Geminocystis sp. NIES-3708]|uniref:LVIVD repeat-containing protein n=1 Tax=Geminocystis sp. NIES-3708 TaxID=1615909 RepID=UPI0005FC510E|nr:hypothetical protein [Geminocystis sp. NIES-3708]BAQ61980.1 alkaline phosphatase [Geminocystis sp. NIES-3708]
MLFENKINLVAAWNPIDFVNDVFVTGNYAYLLGDVLEIIDVSNPNNIQVIASVDDVNTGSFESDTNIVFIQDNSAYISNASNGITVIDISDHNQPLILSQQVFNGVRDIVTVNDKAYTTNRETGLTIFEVANSTNFELIGNYQNLSLSYSQPSNEIAVKGNYAYIADGDLKIFDISNPTNPQLILSYETSRDPINYANDDIYGVEIVDNLAYIFDSEKLRILDINNPLNPQLISSYIYTSGYYYLWAKDFGIIKNYLYVLDQDKGLKVFNVNNPVNPQFIYSYDSPDPSLNLAIAENLAYIAEGNQGVEILDITNPELPLSKAIYTPSGGYSYDIAVVENYGYMANGKKGLQIFNLTDSNNPQLISSHPIRSDAKNITISGNYAYVSYSGLDIDGINWKNGFEIIDISNPTNPQSLGLYNNLSSSGEISIACHYAYVIDKFSLIDGGLQIFDISNPSNPSFVSSFETPTKDDTSSYMIKNIQDIAIKDNYAYTTYSFSGVTIPHVIGLEILDISNPTQPQLVGSIGDESLSSVVVKGNYAYAGISFPGFREYNPPRGGMEIINISNPINPQIVASYSNSNPTKEIQIVGNYAYLLNNESLEILDISDFGNISLIDSYSQLSNPSSFTVSQENIYIADGEDNLKILSHNITNQGEDNQDNINNPSTNCHVDKPDFNHKLDTQIYRFQNLDKPSTYLYAGEEESINIRNNFPNFQEEGKAFKVAKESDDDLIVMNRFQNRDIVGTYLYAGEEESINIRNNFPNFQEEGKAFYVYPVNANKGVDFYRFQNNNILGTYLFVAEEERQNILANFPNFQEEGVAFEVLI